MAKVDIPESIVNVEMTPAETKPKELTKVVTGEVKKKNSLTKSLTSEFVNEEPNYVKDYIVHDILLPAVKVTIAEIISSVTDMFLFGEVRSSRSDSRTKYARRSNDRDRDRRREVDDDRGRRYRHKMRYDDFSDIVFESRSDALKVLEEMRDYLYDCPTISVANFYDLVGEDSEFTDNDYGWTDLKNAYVEGVRGGWIIELPRAKYLK